mmetsp:Transcript_10890/g.40755  ORF Transcript_10890/g.40755 Transcript_10890/m.40755 type:complete len:332 (-) Transcript_10890:95-1090(-)
MPKDSWDLGKAGECRLGFLETSFSFRNGRHVVSDDASAVGSQKARDAQSANDGRAALRVSAGQVRAVAATAGAAALAAADGALHVGDAFQADHDLGRHGRRPRGGRHGLHDVLNGTDGEVVERKPIPESLRVGERGADEGVGGVDEAEVQHAAAGLLVFLGVRLLARVRNDDLHLVAAHAHGDEGELSLHVANVDAVEAEGGDGRIEGDGDGLLRLEELVSGDGVLAIVVAAVDFAGPGANRGHDAREGQVQRRLLVEHELLEAVGGHAIQVVEEGVASVVGVRVDGQRRDVVLAALRVEIFVKEDGRAHGLHGRRERDQQRELEECHDVL